MKKLLLAVFFLLLFAVSSSTAIASNFLLNEDFTTNNGTELSSYDPGWRARFDSVKNSYIQGNEVVDVSNNSGYYFTPLPSISDTCVSADFHSNWQNNSWISIDTRRQGVNDRLYLATIHQQVYFLAKDYVTVLSGTVPNGPLDTNWHNVKFCSIGTVHSLYIDNQFINSFTDASYSSGNIGFDTAVNMHFDNFKVSDETNANITLNVPLFKQTDPSWKNDTYDNAKLWSPTDPSFNSWGCAVTSAAMVFKFNGLNKLPSGSSLNPKTLNEWLKLQKDGYVENGLVNWLALSRLSRQSVSINKILSFDALEFTKVIPGNTNKVKDDLANGIPDILEEPGHFIVAKGTSNGTVQINDPFYARSSLADYGNSVQSINKFSPSHTNLSYIMVTYPLDTNLVIKDSNANSVGQSFQSDTIANPNDSSQTSGNPIMLYYVPKPMPDDYTFTVSSSVDGIKRLKIYMYDKQGNSFQQNSYVLARNNQQSIITKDFEDSDNIYTKKVSYSSLRSDLNNALHKKEIKPELYTLLVAKSIIAETDKKLDRKNEELGILAQMQVNLDSSLGVKVFDLSYSFILYDLNYLESNL